LRDSGKTRRQPELPGVGFGAALLKDAILRARSAAQVVGPPALLDHAKDEDAATFYRHFDLEPSPTEPLNVYLRFADLG